MALKTFPYSVYVNGEIIPPNTPVEVGAPKAETKKPTKKAGVKNDEGTSRES